MKKVTLMLKQEAVVGRQETGYKVEGIKNSVEFSIGQWLEKNDVKEILQRRGSSAVEVVIK